MAELQFIDQHNMVAILSKIKGLEEFHQIIDFLKASHISYALTVNPKIFVEQIQQFWVKDGNIPEECPKFKCQNADINELQELGRSV